MTELQEDPRLRALLLAARNQLDSLWRVAGNSGAGGAKAMEDVLKLIGAIDYALGIERYTFTSERTEKPAWTTPANPAEPAPPADRLPDNGLRRSIHPLDVKGSS